MYCTSTQIQPIQKTTNPSTFFISEHWDRSHGGNVIESTYLKELAKKQFVFVTEKSKPIRTPASFLEYPCIYDIYNSECVLYALKKLSEVLTTTGF
jgi:hypothetical protein